MQCKHSSHEITFIAEILIGSEGVRQPSDVAQAIGVRRAMEEGKCQRLGSFTEKWVDHLFKIGDT